MNDDIPIGHRGVHNKNCAHALLRSFRFPRTERRAANSGLCYLNSKNTAPWPVASRARTCGNCHGYVCACGRKFAPIECSVTIVTHTIKSARVFKRMEIGKQVNVFKHMEIDTDVAKHARLKGDVRRVVDRNIGHMVYQLRGSISSANTLTIPASPHADLGLTGQYVYIQFQSDPKVTSFCVHIECVTTTNFRVRLSLSNLYKELKVRACALLHWGAVCGPSRASVSTQSFHERVLYRICSHVIYTSTPTAVPRRLSRMLCSYHATS
jgi:hypothetical protein